MSDSAGQFFERVIRAFPKYEDQEDMFWTIGDAGIQFWVDCSDTFMWGCGDTEELTPDNIDAYEAAAQFIENLPVPDDPSAGGVDKFCTSALFCARVRKQVPMARYMELIKTPELRKVLEDCGKT